MISIPLLRSVTFFFSTKGFLSTAQNPVRHVMIPQWHSPMVIHRSIGANGDVHQRNSPTLINIAGYEFYTDGDSSIKTLQQQIQIPLFNHQFTELGDEQSKPGILRSFNNDSNYRKLLSDYIPARPTFDWALVIECLTEYCRGLKSYGSKYDAVVAGKSEFTKEEAEGSALFLVPRFAAGIVIPEKISTNPWLLTTIMRIMVFTRMTQAMLKGSSASTLVLLP